MPELTIIIPTLNEAKNIRMIVSAVAGVIDDNKIPGQILIVDDNSTDGTHAIIKDLATVYPLDCIVRHFNHGLSESLAEAFEYASEESDILMVMDADGQHPANVIPALYNAIKEGNDIAIASRYMPGGGVWYVPWYRKLLSWGATSLARLFFPNITDSGSGFFAFKKGVIKDAPLQPQGFRMLFEVLGKGKWSTAKEIPYILQVRREGQSKLKASTILSYLKQLWNLLTYSLTTPESTGYKEIFRVVMFMTVGITGIIVNIGTLYLLTEYANLWYMWAACIGVELSILTNFLLNDRITFWDLPSKLHPLHRFALYHFVCVGGIIVTILTMTILVEMLHLWYIYGSIIGICLAFLWNFSMSRGVAWRE
jgi:dolichol-phosphate mannosyltransferase